MTTDDSQAKHEIVLSIIKNVMLKTSLLMGMGAVGAAVYGLFAWKPAWWSIGVAILFGASLGFLNFRWMAFAIERTLLKRVQHVEPLSPVEQLLNVLKLAAIFIVLFVVMKWQIIHAFGLVIGLSLCFLAIIWEGLTVMARVYREK